tara:strand:- start:377 stop:1084 length:708 start_codon:yes stop_codon:yes gene_type:complete
MALPKPARPEYSTTLPSTGKRIKYQPFTVKEEKVLVLAAEGSDPDEITNAISNVLTTCITSPADIKIEELALFDIEYLFLKTRAKSAGEKIQLKIQDPDDPEFVTDYEINVDKIGVKKQKEHTDLIQMTETMFVKMKYPDISFFNEGIDMSGMDAQFSIVARCISQITDGEDVYQSEDMSAGELEDWLDELTSENFKKITNFFDTMPKLSHTITMKNTNTDKDFTVTLEGLADFF